MTLFKNSPLINEKKKKIRDYAGYLKIEHEKLFSYLANIQDVPLLMG